MINIFRSTFSLLFTGSLLLVSCSRESDLNGTGGEDEILLRGSLYAAASTRGALNGSDIPAGGVAVNFVRSDETSGSVFTAYSDGSPLGASLSQDGSIAFAMKQYYLVNGMRSRFIGWHPAAGSYAGGVATFALNGTTDLMFTNEVSGSVTDLFGTADKTFIFGHALSKVVVSAYTASERDVDKWGTITKMELTDQPVSCSYSPDKKELRFASATSLLALSNPSDDSVMGDVSLSGTGETAAAPCGYALFAPGGSSLSLIVTTSRYGAYPATVTLPAGKTFEEGKYYNILLRFDTNGVSPEVSVNLWTDYEGGNIGVDFD